MSGRLVVFDFDGVLVAGDSMASLLRRMILARWWKRALALAVFPFAMPLLASRRWLPLGARVFRHIAFLGCRGGELRESFEVFGRNLATDPRKARPRAVAALRAHLAAGDRVVVATGTEERIVRAVLDTRDVRGVEVVASQIELEPVVRVRRHCYGPAKCAALAAAGHERWDVAYSDSLADLPLLRGAERAVLVDATPAMLAEAERRLGRAPECVDWR
jgi:phosphatidylglycerophosphatase C